MSSPPSPRAPYTVTEDLDAAVDEIQGRASSPEGISLSCEQLFDAETAKDRPCYLPDETQNDGFASDQDYELREAVKEVNGLHLTSENSTVDTESSADSNGAPLSSETQKNRSKPVMAEGSLINSALGDEQEVLEGTEANDHALNCQEVQEGDQELEPGTPLSPCSTVAMADGSSIETAFRDEREASKDNLRMEDTENGFSQGYQEQELETPRSPSGSSVGGTSGYVAGSGSGSSSATSLDSVNGVEEISDFVQREDRESNETDNNRVDFVPGKQHPDEDDTRSSWRKHKKHFFILSHAGKPIYSRYGDEHKLAGFSATLHAIMSFVENSEDRIRYIRAGDHQIVFLVKGPIYLVSISATDEPVQVLRGQLELLHGQLLLILTKSLEKCLVKNAKFDLKPLLGGTEVVFSSLIHSFSWNPAAFLHSYTCLPLPNAARQAAGAALQDIADADVLFALLLSGPKVISLIGAQKASLHPDDIFLLSNFVSSSESFRTTESFSPVCLPHYNAMAFMYAYVHYLNTDTCLILLTTNSDAFFHLKESRARVESFLIETHVLHDIATSVRKGGLRVEDLPGDSAFGPLARSGRLGRNMNYRASEPVAGSRQRITGVGGAGGLWHFIYRSIYLDQYVASEFSPPLHTRQTQKRLFRAYQRLHASMHGGPAGTHQMQYRRDENHVLLSWSTADFEFFAAFDPLAEKSSAITVCNRVCQWIRDVESDIFYLGASHFSW